MTYKILNASVSGEHVVTTVEYNFDGNIVNVDIYHFMPSGQEDIIQGILNRANTEKSRLESIELNKTLAESIITGVENPIS